MKKKMYAFFVSVMIFFLAGFSCDRERNIEFDETEPLSLSPSVSWALVTEPYVAFRNSESWEGEAVAHCRKGDILMVVGRSIEPDGTWYRFDEGWIFESSLALYSNRYKALSAKREFK